MSKFKVYTHTWVKGIVKTTEYKFQDRDNAINFAMTVKAEVVKVYDAKDRLIHRKNNETQHVEIYA